MTAERSATAAVPARIAVPAQPATQTATPAGAGEIVEQIWVRVHEELARRDLGGVESWLERLEPVALREGTLELVTRSSRAAPALRARMVPLLEQALRRAVGSPVRVRIDVDQSLGGALRALGWRGPAALAPPPPFVPRPETRLAHTALQRLAREPKPEFDQVVLEGPAGVGKSLLLSTFLAQRSRRFPRERWRLERAEPFFRDFASACRDQARASFRGERVACDGFLLDDAQQLAGKTACQETLVEMLEYFRAHGRLVIVATEPFAGGPREFVPAFSSLLRRGLRLVMPQLSAASRSEILAARLRDEAPGLATHAPPAWQGWIDELAAATDVPLGRCVTAVASAAALARKLGRTPRREEIEAEVPELVARAATADPFDRVLDRCAEFVGVPREALVAGVRSRAAALGRHLAVYLGLEVFGLQRATLRRWLGKLSPSVLPYAKSKIEALRATDRRLDGFVREVAEEIGRGQQFLFG